jgi:hypothetical protein
MDTLLLKLTDSPSHHQLSGFITYNTHPNSMTDPPRRKKSFRDRCKKFFGIGRFGRRKAPGAVETQVAPEVAEIGGPVTSPMPELSGEEADVGIKGVPNDLGRAEVPSQQYGFSRRVQVSKMGRSPPQQAALGTWALKPSAKESPWDPGWKKAPKPKVVMVEVSTDERAPQRRRTEPPRLRPPGNGRVTKVFIDEKKPSRGSEETPKPVRVDPPDHLREAHHKNAAGKASQGRKEALKPDSSGAVEEVWFDAVEYHTEE